MSNPMRVKERHHLWKSKMPLLGSATFSGISPATVARLACGTGEQQRHPDANAARRPSLPPLSPNELPVGRWRPRFSPRPSQPATAPQGATIARPSGGPAWIVGGGSLRCGWAACKATESPGSFSFNLFSLSRFYVGTDSLTDAVRLRLKTLNTKESVRLRKLPHPLQSLTESVEPMPLRLLKPSGASSPRDMTHEHIAKTSLSVSSASSQLSSSTHSFRSSSRASKRRASVSESAIQSSTSGNRRSHPVRDSVTRAATPMSRTVRISPALAVSSRRSRPSSRLRPRHRLRVID